jgi:hypothetical protein
MASGHVNRIKRPNTWLHRPMLQNVKKALANPEPSTHGTFETCRPGATMSASEGRPEVSFRGLFAEANGLGPNGARLVRANFFFVGQNRRSN